jgi:methyl-accepting chemotaxis protein
VNKISLKMKLGLGFGVLLLIIAVMGITSYTSVNKLSDLSDEVQKQMYNSQLASDVDAGIELQTSAGRGFVLSGNERILSRRAEGIAENDKSMQELSKLLQSEKGKELYNKVDAGAKELRELQGQAIELRRRGKTNEAIDMLFTEHATQVRTDAEKAVDDLKGLSDKLFEAAKTEHEQVEASTIRLLIILAIVGLIVGLGVAAFIVRSITGAIQGMVTMIQQIAANNLGIDDMHVASQDEIGKAAIALNGMKNSLREMIRSIAGTAEQVASASEELSSTSQEITANSEETSTQAQVVSSSSEQVNKNLQTVATGSEEMSASIKEIAKNAHESAKVATSAVRVADETNQIVAKLGDSSTEIGQVIKVITSIAQQTNLLALNATIEAARAGEAGKGFAVVANEVKELAKQTAKATEDISRKIEAIQGDTKSAVAAIGQIGEVIKQVNDISNTIATAVEEQNATTNEMARNVSEAARGSSEITKNISGVAQAAQSTAHGAGDSSKAAGSLAEMSTKLRELVAQFRLEKDAYAELQPRPQTPKAMSARAGA